MIFSVFLLSAYGLAGEAGGCGSGVVLTKLPQSLCPTIPALS
ncbi:MULTISPECIES: hypothetical protein [Trichocoleus]|nr:hypothetical protein [Trichocoleus sp. FACHB-46]